MFLCNNVVSPDINTNIHPKLARNEIYAAEILCILQQHIVPNSEVWEAGVKEYIPNYGGKILTTLSLSFMSSLPIPNDEKGKLS
eukprot:15068228-Ditylum_brightwellii.AAC.1